MCEARPTLAELCRQMADLECRLSDELKRASWSEKEHALTVLKRRGDTWAERVLRDYLAPAAPLGIEDELAGSSQG